MEKGAELDRITCFAQFIYKKTSGAILKCHVLTIPGGCQFAVVTNKILGYAVRIWYDDFIMEPTCIAKSIHFSSEKALNRHEEYLKLCDGVNQVEITNKIIKGLILEKEEKILVFDILDIEGYSCGIVLTQDSKTRFNVKVYGLSLRDSKCEDVWTLLSTKLSGLILIEDKIYTSYAQAIHEFELKIARLGTPTLIPSIRLPPDKELIFSMKGSDDTVESLYGLFNMVKHYKKWNTIRIAYTSVLAAVGPSHSVLLLTLVGDDQTALFLRIHYGRYEETQNNPIKEWVKAIVSDEFHLYGVMKKILKDKFSVNDAIPIAAFHSHYRADIEVTKRLAEDIEYMIRYLITMENYNLLRLNCQIFAHILQVLIKRWKDDIARRIIMTRNQEFHRWIVLTVIKGALSKII